MLLPPQRQQNRNPMYSNRSEHFQTRRMAPSRGRNSMQNRNGKGNILQQVLGSQSQITDVATKGVGGLSKTLSGVQQVLNVVQSAAPIVQEYGPMIKNLPAMYRMMKAFKDIDSESENESDELETTKVQSVELDTKETDLEEKKVEKSNPSGSSTPKLYI